MLLNLISGDLYVSYVIAFRHADMWYEHTSMYFVAVTLQHSLISNCLLVFSVFFFSFYFELSLQHKRNIKLIKYSLLCLLKDESLCLGCFQLTIWSSRRTRAKIQTSLIFYFNFFILHMNILYKFSGSTATHFIYKQTLNELKRISIISFGGNLKWNVFKYFRNEKFYWIYWIYWITD